MNSNIKVGDTVVDKSDYRYEVLNFSPNNKYARLRPLSYQGVDWAYMIKDFRLLNSSYPKITPDHLVPKETLVVNESGGMKGDGDKLDYTLLEWSSFRDLVKLMMFGAKKYNRDNWRKVEPARYQQALLRHVAAFAEGEWTDADSGVPHCACIMFNAMVLIWFKKEGKLDDLNKN